MEDLVFKSKHTILTCGDHNWGGGCSMFQTLRDRLLTVCQKSQLENEQAREQSYFHFRRNERPLRRILGRCEKKVSTPRKTQQKKRRGVEEVAKPRWINGVKLDRLMLVGTTTGSGSSHSTVANRRAVRSLPMRHSRSHLAN
jgi:hypothetical protein